MIWTKLFFKKNTLSKLFLNAETESLLLNSKVNVFQGLRALTKKDFPPSVLRIYLGQTKLSLAYLVFLEWTWLLTVKCLIK